MHPLLAPAYEAVAQVARGLAASAPAGDHKLLRTLRARRGIIDRYRRWGLTGREPARPLLWMHAPSVGEGLQARPVIRILRERYPIAQVAYTHFSPSAEAFARTVEADFTDYLPFDSGPDSKAALEALRPSALLFAKLDVWPRLVLEAARRGVKTGVISATLPARSHRRSAIGRAFLRDAYARLDAVGAIDEADAERLVEVGVRTDVVRVTGDTRYDQVWERAHGVDRHAPLLSALASSRPTVVAGSTWPADERVLLEAFERARAAEPTLRLLIAPHEPTPAHVAAIEEWAGRRRIATARLGAAGAEGADVILVDRVGVLGDLYALADIAFVGGGFHDAGLHSVLEPAAFGTPVTFGPRTGGVRDAELLIARGGGFVVGSAGPLTEKMLDWVRSPARRAEAGARARAVVADGIGAAGATYDLVRTLLPE